MNLDPLTQEELDHLEDSSRDHELWRDGDEKDDYIDHEEQWWENEIN